MSQILIIMFFIDVNTKFSNKYMYLCNLVM